MRAFVLLSHELLPEQVEELRVRFGVGEVVVAEEGLRRDWSLVPADAESVVAWAERFTVWLASGAREGDVVVVQGEAGVSFYVVSWCLDRGLVPVHATTVREVVEEREEAGGVRKVSRFRHVRFRRYERP